MSATITSTQQRAVAQILRLSSDLRRVRAEYTILSERLDAAVERYDRAMTAEQVDQDETNPAEELDCDSHYEEAEVRRSTSDQRRVVGL